MVGKIPLYIQLYNRLRIDIEEGVYSPGERLPSESDLEAKYNTSRITIRKAHFPVGERRLCVCASGAGHHCRLADDVQHQLRHFPDRAVARGGLYALRPRYSYFPPHGARGNRQRHGPVSKHGNGLRAAHTACRRAAVGILSNYILPEVVPDIEKKDHNFISLYRFLEDEYNIRIDTSRDFISARTADLAQATTLKIPVGSPLIYVIRISFSDGAPILGDIAYINGYMHHFSFNRSGRSPRLHIAEDASNRSSFGGK